MTTDAQPTRFDRIEDELQMLKERMEQVEKLARAAAGNWIKLGEGLQEMERERAAAELSGSGAKIF